MGNVRRGQLYPLCVGAERVMQAQTIARMARKLGTDVVAHGCTAAGNDQVRFEVALRTLAPDLKVLAPVRDRAFRREEELAYLQERKLPIPASGAKYSVNRGLWGVTIGGKETLTSAGSIPDEAWILTKNAFSAAARRRAPRAQLRQGTPGRPRRQGLGAGRAHRGARGPGGALWHRPRHSPRRHDHRHQGARGVRGPGRRGAAQRPPRAREAGAHRSAAAHQGARGAALRGLSARGAAARSGVPRYRGAAAELAGARYGRRAPRAADRQSLYRRSRVRFSLMAASKGVYGEAAGEWSASDALGFSRIVSCPGCFTRRAAPARPKDRKPWSACAASSSTSSPR